MASLLLWFAAILFTLSHPQFCNLNRMNDSNRCSYHIRKPGVCSKLSAVSAQEKCTSISCLKCTHRCSWLTFQRRQCAEPARVRRKGDQGQIQTHTRRKNRGVTGTQIRQSTYLASNKMSPNHALFKTHLQDTAGARGWVGSLVLALLSCAVCGGQLDEDVLCSGLVLWLAGPGLQRGGLWWTGEKVCVDLRSGCDRRKFQYNAVTSGLCKLYQLCTHPSYSTHTCRARP